MLNIYHSNSIEVLLLKLAEQLAAQPLASVFTPELVIAPSPAMARWVNIELAGYHGIAANIDYPLPSTFIWRIARTILTDIPERDPLSIASMSWKCFRYLPDFLEQPAFEALRHYLANDDSGIKRWQLSTKIADTFDRYQLYRPDLIRKWSAGEDDQWQAVLWRKFLSTVSHHRVNNIDRMLAYLQNNAPNNMPQRLSFFAVSSLPPYFIDIIHALSQHTQFDLYLHSPTPEFWADLKSQKELARKRIQTPEQAELWEVGHELLASWGRQGQALQDRLLQGEHPINETDAFIEPSANSLLSRLQQDIFNLRSEPDALTNIEADDSLQVHVCHSPLRECQVLHDELLDLFQRYPDIKPEDVLVMIPEINLYAPYIEAAFHYDEDSSRPYIPWNLSDLSFKDEHPVLQVFLQLLDLPHSRFTHSEICSYLDVPEITQRFELDSSNVEQIKQWLLDTNLRWGIDPEHKQAFGLPGYVENTWQQTEERLFSAYALEPVQLYEGMAPINGLEGSDAEILGRFWHLIETLKKYRAILFSNRTLVQWQERLYQLLNEFFIEIDDEDSRIQLIRDAIDTLTEQGGELEETVSSELVRFWLNQQLGSQTRRGRYFSGGVTFCGMRPMRSVPFKVICLLGMYDQAFPRRETMTEFDLMASSYRAGDPRKGEEDRYLFLQTLLCARHTLYISYIGRDNRSNEKRQPSVLVQELLDYIAQYYQLDADRLVHEHSLQPFSPRNFTGPRASFDHYWCNMATAIRDSQRNSSDPITWKQTVLAPITDESGTYLTVSGLIRFIQHPIRFFVNHRLRIYLEDESDTDDDEFFALDNLQAYQLSQRILDSEISNNPLTLQQLSAEGNLPHGIFSEPCFHDCETNTQAIQSVLQSFIGQTPQKRLIDLELEDHNGRIVHLSGELNNIFAQNTLMQYRAGKLKGINILVLWLQHLIWCAADESAEKYSVLYCKDKMFSLNTTLSPESARQQILEYIGLYTMAKTRPLPVFKYASYAYVQALMDKDHDTAIEKAAIVWKGNSFNKVPTDQDDEYVRLITAGQPVDPLSDEEFSQLARTFYLRALEEGEISELY